MSFLRQTTLFRASGLRTTLAVAPRTQIQSRFASQGYGNGDGNPAGERPQEQGKNPREDLEHPGPPPPKTGRGKSSSQNEEGSGQVQSQSKSGQEGKGKGPQPKILNANPPQEQDESVRQHNQEMDQRADRAHEQISNADAPKDKARR
ncbi:hypothetical protein EJ04DRAFT_509799 [Polyplosphaeria fusca]|uniref:Uncharacterized protein n=1 Tax=Polyplosphaeria fusca TaxID=682080 RepID=A0A9P4V764_9PLEO|nr:hypothetical protein EJ04DRAFT_509799 [Polyplosphaeria fusca]